MEQKNTVSIWFGNFRNEDELTEYMQEQFTDDRDVYSKFSQEFKIDYIDSQFQEILFSDSLTINKLKSLSYSESFIELIKLDVKNTTALLRCIISNTQIRCHKRKTSHL